MIYRLFLKGKAEIRFYRSAVSFIHAQGSRGMHFRVVRPYRESARTLFCDKIKKSYKNVQTGKGIIPIITGRTWGIQIRTIMG